MTPTCPIREQTADGTVVGRCCMQLRKLQHRYVCPRHGDVTVEVARWHQCGLMTLENVMRKRKGLPTFPIRED
jgi:hypothetical protein